MDLLSSVHRASRCLLVLLFCFTVQPLSALPADLDVPHGPVMPPAHAPAHHPHHHHLLAAGPTPLHAPAHAPAEHRRRPRRRREHYHNATAPVPARAPVRRPGPPPAHAPSKPPAHAPSQAPVHPPSYAPPTVAHVPRSFIAVQGVVYCKSCKYAGVDTFLGATPLLGAEVKLECNSSRRPVVGTTMTDKNGYFYITAPKTVTSYTFHKCKVSLVSSPPSSACKKPSDFHGGLSGAALRPVKPFMANKLPFVLYSVGPHAFEPDCHH